MKAAVRSVVCDQRIQIYFGEAGKGLTKTRQRTRGTYKAQVSYDRNGRPCWNALQDGREGQR